ncbi:hypothetical protein LOTGIDRAFT_162491 [Lottia gigantea]|uniref:Ig-like domain-containing protein n=1 Tax=Lottia gigantea TaxID=225164 RepID=V4AGN6_LOTGI|nr:hypothetical protein LOTGIDRAFT_162491 [Lottia gigantea]ESO92581.1 hypothetical protein LOTGIDRAFT_162491 [Lottia gigantea]
MYCMKILSRVTSLELLKLVSQVNVCRMLSSNVYVQDTNITHGEDAIIKCDPEPHLEQLEVIWYKFNQPLESVPGLYPRIHLTDHNHTLTIKQAKYLKLTSRHLKTQTQIILDTNGIEDSNFDAAVDAGEYRCDIIFYHGFKRLEQTFTKTAKMYGKPKIIDSGTSSRKFTVMKNETLRLVCSVTGYPSPDVVWLKNGEIVREQNIASSKRAPFLITYTIRNLSKSDAGEYACSFENMMGRAIKTIQEYKVVNISDRLNIGGRFAGDNMYMIY